EVDGVNIPPDIRTHNLTKNVSHETKHPLIRAEMVKRKQELAKNGAVVRGGRDIGTFVLPKSELKIFLIASVEERANKRHEENIQNGLPSDLSELKEEIKTRDLLDSK